MRWRQKHPTVIKGRDQETCRRGKQLKNKSRKKKSLPPIVGLILDALRALRQPDISEEEENGDEEKQPHSPAHARTLGHAQHSVHSAPKTDTRAIECVIHLVREGRRLPDLITNSERDLRNIDC